MLLVRLLLPLIFAQSLAFPTAVPCGTKLSAGDVVMGNAIQRSASLVPTFVSDHACGGSFAPGESVDIEIPAGTWLVDIEGARSVDVSTCPSGRVVVSQSTATTDISIVPGASTITITIC